MCAGGRRLASLMVLLVAPRVFRAPEGPAAREARRPHFVRRRASKPARALRSLRRPPHLWGWAAPWAAARPLAVRAASLRLGASDRSSARPRRRPWVLQPGRADRAAWLPETVVAFVRSYPCGLKPSSPLRMRIRCFRVQR